MIREMIHSDIISIVNLEEKIFKESLGYNFLYNELKFNPFQKYFIYEINKELIGYIGLRIYDEEAEILNFLINDKYQNKGYGKRFLKFVISYLKTRKIKTVTLEVSVLNKKALKLYQKLNFEIVLIKPKYYKDKSDAYLLKRNVYNDNISS